MRLLIANNAASFSIVEDSCSKVPKRVKLPVLWNFCKNKNRLTVVFIAIVRRLYKTDIT